MTGGKRRGFIQEESSVQLRPPITRRRTPL